MKKWRNILQRKEDVWTSSFRGLDTLALKPEIISEQKPIFRLGYRGGLVCRRELRSEEAYLKSFTPFFNKKTPDYLKRLRTAFYEPNGEGEESLLETWLSLGGGRSEGLTIEQEEELHNIFMEFFNTRIPRYRHYPEGYEAPPVEEESVAGVPEMVSVSGVETDFTFTTPEDIRSILRGLDEFEREGPARSEAVGGGSASVGGAAGGGAMPEMTEGEGDVVESAEKIMDSISKLHAFRQHLSRAVDNKSLSPEVRAIAAGGQVDLIRATVRLQDMLQKVPGGKAALEHIRANGVPERRQLLNTLHSEMRRDADFMKEHPVVKAWEAYFLSRGWGRKAGKGEREEYAESRFKKAGESDAETASRRNLYIGKGKATTYDAINAGLVRAGKPPPGANLGVIRSGSEWLKAKEAAAVASEMVGGGGGGR